MKKRDFLIIASILVVAIACYFLIQVNKKEGTQVVVRIDGNEVARYSLSVDGEYELNNGTNILCIKDGEAYLIDAKCPDHLCVKQGKIHYNGETITCLPYKLTITVDGGEAPKVDLVS